jgi:hypothetical protein
MARPFLLALVFSLAADAAGADGLTASAGKG